MTETQHIQIISREFNEQFDCDFFVYQNDEGGVSSMGQYAFPSDTKVGDYFTRTKGKADFQKRDFYASSWEETPRAQLVEIARQGKASLAFNISGNRVHIPKGESMADDYHAMDISAFIRFMIPILAYYQYNVKMDNPLRVEHTNERVFQAHKR